MTQRAAQAAYNRGYKEAEYDARGGNVEAVRPILEQVDSIILLRFLFDPDIKYEFKQLIRSIVLKREGETMSEKTNNQKIIDSVAALQSREDLHPLTCGKDSRHGLLEAKEVDGKVVLVCPDCDYVQTWIPGCIHLVPPAG